MSPRDKDAAADESVRFGSFVLDGRLRELHREGRKVSLQPKPMALLWYLIRNRDRMVPGDELLAEVWPDAHVGDQALAGTLRDLRRALDDGGHTLIQTRRGHGYRFTGEIESTVVEERPSGVPSTPPVRVAPAAAHTGVGLVGRDRELELLRHALDAAVSGVGRVSVVAGPAGIGKTRLVDELAAEAAARGVRVHVGPCPSTAGVPPLWPWTQVARSCLQSARDDAQRGVWLATAESTLSALLPELPGAGDRADASMEASQARFEAAHALVRLLGVAAGDEARLLVVEDLHWADPGSLAVLEVVAQSLHELRVLIVVTLREEEAGRRDELRRALAAVHRSRGCERISLAGLDARAVQTLLNVSSPTSESLAERVCDVTSGNALFVTELARLHAEGKLSAANGDGGLPLPRAVRDAMELQLDQRSPECREALRAAAVSGDEFGIEILRRVLGAAHEDLFEVLSEADEAGLIAEDPSKPGTYRFCHSMWREFLYEGLSKVQVRRMHLKTGEALEAVHASDLHPHVGVLARHFSQAATLGGAERAVRYTRAVAERCERQHAPAEAAEQYALALGALEFLPDVDVRVRSELHIACGIQMREAHGPVAQQEETRAMFQAGVRLARQAQDADLLARGLEESVQLELEPFFYADVLPSPALIQHLESELLDAVERAADGSAARARVLLSLAWVRGISSTPTEAEARVREAEAIAERLDDPDLVREALMVRWWLAQAPEALDQRRWIAERLHHGKRTVSRRGRQRVRWLASVHFECGDLAAADALIPVALDPDGRRPWEEPDVWPWRVMRAVMSGQFRAAERILARADRIDSYFVRIELQVQGLWLRLLQGRASEFLWLLESVSRGHGSLYPVLLLARCYADLDRVDEARETLARALAHFRSPLRFDLSVLGPFTTAAEVMYWTDGAERAGELYEQLEPYEDRLVLAGWMAIFGGAVSRSLGLLAAAQKSWDRAVGHLERALETHHRIGALPFRAFTELELARVLSRRGQHLDVPRARELARSAHVTASELGMATLERRARAELDSLDGTP